MWRVVTTQVAMQQEQTRGKPRKQHMEANRKRKNPQALSDATRSDKKPLEGTKSQLKAAKAKKNKTVPKESLLPHWIPFLYLIKVTPHQTEKEKRKPKLSPLRRRRPGQR